MPRAQQSLEERILHHFKTAPLGEVKLLHRLTSSTVRERTVETSTPAAPARSTRNRKPAAGSGRSGNHGSKKKAASRRRATGGGSGSGSGSGAPADDEIPT